MSLGSSRARSSVGRALPLHGRGRGFESLWVHLEFVLTYKFQLLNILSLDEMLKQKLLPDKLAFVIYLECIYIFVNAPVPSFFGMEEQAMKVREFFFGRIFDIYSRMGSDFRKR